jgi:hypothetical protein
VDNKQQTVNSLQRLVHNPAKHLIEMHDVIPETKLDVSEEQIACILGNGQAELSQLPTCSYCFTAWLTLQP